MELAEEVDDVELDGRLCDHQVSRDAAVRLAAGEESQDVELSAGEEILEDESIVNVGASGDRIELARREGGGAGSGTSCIDVSLSSIERAVSHSTNWRVRSR